MSSGTNVSRGTNVKSATSLCVLQSTTSRPDYQLMSQVLKGVTRYKEDVFKEKKVEEGKVLPCQVQLRRKVGGRRYTESVARVSSMCPSSDSVMI